MAHTKKNYEDVKGKHGLHFMREPLKLQNHGFSVLEMEEGQEGMEHDHEDDGQEEVYFLVEGKAEIEIEGETIEMEPGDTVSVSPGDSRKLRALEGSKFVITGAP